MANPYPETVPDEASGIEVKDPCHNAWEEGREFQEYQRDAKADRAIDKELKEHNAHIKGQDDLTKNIQQTEEYKYAIYWAELSSPTKGKRAIDELVEIILKSGQADLIGEFNKWADEIITSLEAVPSPTEFYGAGRKARIDTLTAAKDNLARLAREKK